MNIKILGFQVVNLSGETFLNRPLDFVLSEESALKEYEIALKIKPEEGWIIKSVTNVDVPEPDFENQFMDNSVSKIIEIVGGQVPAKDLDHLSRLRLDMHSGIFKLGINCCLIFPENGDFDIPACSDIFNNMLQDICDNGYSGVLIKF